MSIKITESLIRIRKSKGLTQSDLAAALNMERANYSRIERRGNKITIEQLERIAKVLGVTVTDIIAYDPASRENRLSGLGQQLKSFSEYQQLAEQLLKLYAKDEKDYERSIRERDELLDKYERKLRQFDKKETKKTTQNPRKRPKK